MANSLVPYALALLLAAACDSTHPGADARYSFHDAEVTLGDARPASGNVYPEVGSTIAATTDIVINFTSSMLPATLLLSGEMGPESNGGTWATMTEPNDTLRIRAAPSWSGGDHALVVDVDTSAAIPVTMALDYSVDAVTPTATALPATDSVLAADQALVLSFSETMARCSVALDGTMAAATDAAAWTTTLVVDDTLTLSPITSWPSGVRTLIINATDMPGNALATLKLDYLE